MAGSYVGFGFGAIQGGLFLPAVQSSGNFDRILVAEIDPIIVEGVRANQGSFSCNIAHDDGGIHYPGGSGCGEPHQCG